MMDSNAEDVENNDLVPPDNKEQSESVSLDQEENTVLSIDASRDSAESDTDEKGDKTDSSPVKPTFKSILQAKKRLQAYSFTKVAKKPTKDEKNDEAEKADKNTPKKPRKSQPLDRAKAVMEEIEEIKRQELRDEMVKQELIAATVKLIEANRRSRSRSSSPGRDRQFKRREIKSRNYRRTDSSNRKSASPDDRRRSSRRSQPGPVYPKNWTEYGQQNMTVRKDIELKSKLFPDKKLRHYEIFKKCHNFAAPSPIIESYKYSMPNGDTKETPQGFLRYTRACPNIPYNVNFKIIKESCMSRSQLFSIIPYERRQKLEKLFSLSKPLPTSKKPKIREWYSKSWKSKTDADCKILENSVGLSFLQNYSDQEDEENETEDIVICSSTQNNSKSETAERAPSEELVESVDITSPAVSQTKTYSPIFEEVKGRSPSPPASLHEVVSPIIVEDKAECYSLSSQIEEKASERYSPDLSYKDMEDNEDCEVDKNLSGNFTPDNTDFHNKNRDDFEETKYAVETQELDLPERLEIVKEKSVKVNKKKKDKKAHKADNADEKSLKSKPKKKLKRKHSTSTSAESVSSSDRDKKKKKNKKNKPKKKTIKKSPVKKKRKNKKDKVKKKKVNSDVESDEKPKKKRKRVDSSSESDGKKQSTKKPKKSKKKKKSVRDSESEDVQRSHLIEKDDNDWEDIEETDQNRDKTSSSRKSEKNYIIPVIEIDDLKMSNEAKSFEIELNIDKKYLQRNKSMAESQENAEPTLSDNILCLPKPLDVKKEPEWEYTPDRSDICVENDSCNNNDQRSSHPEEPNVNKLPTFNSWESDDEFETSKPDVVAVPTKSSSEDLDFEMPLNIKPFKKREVAEYDIFKENNMQLEETKQITEKSDVEDADQFPITEQSEIPKLPLESKRGRWDRRDSVQKTPTLKFQANLEPEVTVKEVISTINPVKTAVLENEYEEFMKALTVTESNDSTKNSSNSSSAFGFPESDIKNIKKDLSTLVKDEKATHSEAVLILPKDVPLIPIPAEVKPIPVPSPKLKIEETTFPVINTPSSKVPVDCNLRVKPSIDLVSPKKEKNRLNIEPSRKKSVDNLVSSTGAENQYLPDLASISLPPSKEDNDSKATKSAMSSESVDPLVSSASEVIPEKKEKPFTFVGMTLSSKRVLLDKSKVILDDSDDEDIKNKSLQKLEELEAVVGTDIKEEQNLESTDKDRINVQPIPPKDQPCEQTEPMSSESKPVKEAGLTRSSSPKQGRHSPPRNRRGSPHRRRDASPKRYGSPRRRTPDRRYPSKSNTSPRRKRDYSPRKRSISPRRRSISPRRRSISPRRRGGSPRRKRSSSPRRRGSPSRRRSITPKRRHGSPRKRIISPRRSMSPRDRRSTSPRRKRIHSPREKMDMSPSVKRRRSKTPDHYTHSDSNRPKSPPPIASPLQGPKRSVADSTISDDLLPQPNSHFDDHMDSPIASYHHRLSKSLGSPKRMPLDSRINEVLGVKPEPKTTISSTYNAYTYQHEPYQQSGTTSTFSNVYGNLPNACVPKSKSTFVQVGNMVQIVPTELPLKMDIPPPQIPVQQMPNIRNPPAESVQQEKSKIVQVGNMLQIVPTTLPAQVITNVMPEIKKEVIPDDEEEKVVCNMSPIEIPIKLKTAESRAEKEKRRTERELRRAEKERKRKEREKKGQVKLKQKTEDMIKRALQLEAYEQEDEEAAYNETPMQWPPLSVVPGANKEVGKSILVQAGARRDSHKLDKRKIVQFADGVKPGEGTSPSGGEELMSPPPSKKLPKEKRYKKTKLFKTQKKKVKVKVIKKLPKIEDSDEEDDDLPPPSPPPGSPPPHIFPPRVKVHALNNVRTFLPNLVPGHQNQPHVTFTPPLNVLMAHPSAIHQPPPLPPSSTIVLGHHVPVTSVPPPIHHGTPSAVPTLLHHGSVPAVISPMHQGAVPMHHGLTHHTGPPSGTHGLSHPHASFHF